jgi:hypothetical protein
LAKNIDHTDKSPISYLKGNFQKSIYLTPTNSTEIINIIKDLKNGSAGRDNISAKMGKQSLDILVNPLVHVLNLSISTGVFPKELKVAKVIPLFKSGGRSLFTNNRPVSVLPALSKVFEKVFLNLD